MRVVIAGGHGKIAKLLERELAGRGDTAVGLIRNPDHAAALRAAGAQPVVCDLEHTDVDTVTAHLTDADAVVFAAGAGPGSGAARKDTVDRAAAVLLADAAQAAGVRRYLLVSSMGVDAPPSPGRDEVWAAYLAAKKAAEQDVTGRHAPPGPVTRADVARVLLALLYAPDTAGLTLELVGGETPIADAVAALTR